MAKKTPTAKQKNKVKKVMREFKVGKLTTHGKTVKKRDQAVAIALSEADLSKKAKGGKSMSKEDFVENVKDMHKSIDEVILKDGTHVAGKELMKSGGNIKDQYKGKSGKEVWEAWTSEQRIHFMQDHIRELADEKVEEYSVLSFDRIPADVQAEVGAHVHFGQYEEGGEVADGAKILIISDKNTLSKQLTNLTGDTYSVEDFEDVYKSENVFLLKHKKTGKHYVVFTLRYYSQVDLDEIKNDVSYIEKTFDIKVEPVRVLGEIVFNSLWGKWQVYLDGSLYEEFNTYPEAFEHATHANAIMAYEEGGAIDCGCEIGGYYHNKYLKSIFGV